MMAHPKKSLALVAVLVAAAAAEDAWPYAVVATWEGCAVMNVSDDYAGRQQFLDNVAAKTGTSAARAAAGCDRYCANHNYYGDRCFAPRTWCVMRYVGANFAFVVSNPMNAFQLKPIGTEIVAGKYIVVFGAAAAIGTTVTTGFDHMLAEDGYQIVNLGRGSSGPKHYLDEWTAIERIVVNAAAVVVAVMSIRASPNSYCGPECTGTERMRVWRDAEDNATAQFEMEEESMVNSIIEHEELLAKIATSPYRLGTAPQRLLLWHSRCHFIDGCTDGGHFPQWITNPDRVAKIKGLNGWDGILDASYFGYKGSDNPPIPIDKCDNFDAPADFMAGCARRDPTIEKTCSSGAARAETKNDDKDGCTKSCKYIKQDYYPIQLGHDNSYNVLKPALDAALAGWTYGDLS